MSKASMQDRLAVKTPEAAFLHVLRREFNFPPRVSRELPSTVKEMSIFAQHWTTEFHSR